MKSSFKLAWVTHSISLSSVRAQVVTYYTEVFGGNAAETLVFDVLGWWLYPRHCLFPIYRAWAVYEHRFFRKLVDREEIFSESDKMYFGLES